MARGEQAPRRDHLLQAVTEYVVQNARKAGLPRPDRICVGSLWRGDIPRGIVVDFDLAPLQARLGPDPKLVSLPECGTEHLPDAWLVEIAEVERWWDTPDEYEVLGQFWHPTLVQAGTLPVVEDSMENFRLVAVHRSGDWSILRRVTRAAK